VNGSESLAKSLKAGNRILIGRAENGESLWMLPSVLPNSNILLTGGSGQGKTSQIKSMLYQILGGSRKSISVIIDYNDDYITDFADALGERAVVIDLPLDGLPFDLMELPTDSFSGKQISIEERIECLSNHFKDCLPSLGHIQLAFLKDGLRRLYQQKRTFAELPKALHELFLENQDSSIRRLLAQISHLFALDLFPENPSFRLGSILDGKSVSVVIARIKIASRPIQTLVGTFLLHNLFHFCQMRGQQETSDERGLTLVLDEAHRYMRLDSLKHMLQTFFREGRNFGVSTWAATQSIRDIPDSILTNTDTKFYFGCSTSPQNSRAAARALSVLGVTEGDVADQLLTIGRGSALVANSEIRPFRLIKTIHFDRKIVGRKRRNLVLRKQVADAGQVAAVPGGLLRAPDREFSLLPGSLALDRNPEGSQSFNLPSYRIPFGIKEADATVMAERICERGMPSSCFRFYYPLVTVLYQKPARFISQRRISVWDGGSGHLVRSIRPLTLFWDFPPAILDLTPNGMQLLYRLVSREKELDRILIDEQAAVEELVTAGVARRSGEVGVSLIGECLALPSLRLPNKIPGLDLSDTGKKVYSCDVNTTGGKVLRFFRVGLGAKTLEAFILLYPCYAFEDGKLILSGARKNEVVEFGRRVC